MTTAHISIPVGCTFHCLQYKFTVNVTNCALLVNCYKKVIFPVRELSCPAIITSE